MYAVSDKKSHLDTEQLVLSAKLAGMNLPQDFLLNSPYAQQYAKDWDAQGNSPRAVQWRQFHSAVAYPKIQPQSQEAFLTRHAERQAIASAKRAAAEAAAAVRKATLSDTPRGPIDHHNPDDTCTDDELRHYHQLWKNDVTSKFNDLRAAFRHIDQAGKGYISHEEALAASQGGMGRRVTMPERVSKRFIDIADYSGDGAIQFSEFARLATADDIMNIKATLDAAAGKNTKTVCSKNVKHKAAKSSRVIKNGVTEQELRDCVQIIQEKIKNKFKRIDEAFKLIDEDRSGFLSREEFRFCLYSLNLGSMRPETVELIIDLMDADGDGKVEHHEFTRLITAADPLSLGDDYEAAF